MGRKLIVAGSFFVIGLLITAFITLTLLLSLINRPAALSVARIAGAVTKSLDLLEKKGKLISGKQTASAPGSALTLSATTIVKAKQKEILSLHYVEVNTATRPIAIRIPRRDERDGRR